MFHSDDNVFNLFFAIQCLDLNIYTRLKNVILILSTLYDALLWRREMMVEREEEHWKLLRADSLLPQMLYHLLL